MKISIFGTGYVGLVSGACLAELGHQVMCIAVDKQKIENLKNGVIPIYEPELEELVKRNYNVGRLIFSCDSVEGVKFGKAIFSAVGTPPDKENNNKADLKYVYEVAKTFGENIEEYKLFINKSTVPVGTGKSCRDIIKKEIQKRQKDIEFDVASNPEFLREGTAIYDFLNPDRVVCGTQNEKARQIMEEIYKPLSNRTKIIFTDIASAEIIKYAANSFLATKISFINEIANFAEKVGGNILDISRGIGADNRIGNKFLESGIGYGGSCFPKDIKAFIETAKDYDYEFKIIKETENVNEKQKTIVIDKLLEIIPDLKGKTISIWGLAFKPNTDDIREAPSISVINRLLDLGVEQIRSFDPVCMKHMEIVFRDKKEVIFCETNYEAIEDSEALIILTEWNEFKIPDIKRLRKGIKGNIIIDGRNIWADENLQNEGFIYKGVGKVSKKHLITE
ncbi:MAG: UDP-glucose/GDP-mannose dehydrogenase family protein [Candidatus Gracilibacteria bacterium]|nr:UDP-glucose/GDP-mannose dehydrogenase family protein [Candidatus Gracilibacteria bacterium]